MGISRRGAILPAGDFVPGTIFAPCFEHYSTALHFGSDSALGELKVALEIVGDTSIKDRYPSRESVAASRTNLRVDF